MGDATSRAATIRFPTGAKPRMTLKMRFYEKVGLPDANGCLPWLAGRDSKPAGQQYGIFKIGSRSVNAHRFAYQLAAGPILDGFVIDHICRNRLCVRPDHLDAVPQRENVHRGLIGQKIECPHGHPLDATVNRSNGKSHRRCSTCNRESVRRHRAARSA